MEEAELEMDLILNEQGMSESFKELKDFPDLPFLSSIYFSLIITLPIYETYLDVC